MTGPTGIKQGGDTPEGGSPPFLLVVCAVFQNDKQILAARRPEDRALGGLWEFPGGKIENGETPREALQREIREEMGIEVVITTELPLPPPHPSTKGFSIQLIPFLCPAPAFIPQGTEHSEFRWVNHTNWQELSWCPADVPLLHHLFDKGSDILTFAESE